jgi:hypothetical protein
MRANCAVIRGVTHSYAVIVLAITARRDILRHPVEPEMVYRPEEFDPDFIASEAPHGHLC